VKCKHDKGWSASVLPWGTCRACGKDIQEYIGEVLRRAYKAIDKKKHPSLAEELAILLNHKDAGKRVKNED